MNPPFEIGDSVLTPFYEHEKKLIRKVVGVYRQSFCQSGWFVQTIIPDDLQRNILACDSGWYVRFNPDDEHTI